MKIGQQNRLGTGRKIIEGEKFNFLTVIKQVYRPNSTKGTPLFVSLDGINFNVNA